MTQKKSGLGRSPLDALLGPRTPVLPQPTVAPELSGIAARIAAAGSSAATAPVALRDQDLARIPLDLLQRGRFQPRVDMRPESLQELADSIKAQGVIQPIVVRPIPGPAEQRYEIIAGERRWRAAQLAGLADIPAVIRSVSDNAAIAMALIENIQREDLNPLEEARALDRLVREFNVTHQQAAEAVGRSRAAVSNLLRLLELAPEVAQHLERREIEMGHARALLGLPSRRQQVEVAARVVRDGLSVRATEAAVRAVVSAKTGAKADESASVGARIDPNVLHLQQELTEKLGAAVSIQSAAGGKGKLVISYNSHDELDGILAHIR